MSDVVISKEGLMRKLAIDPTGVIQVQEALSADTQKQATRTKFDRDEQLAAIMEQIKAIADHTGTPIADRFALQLAARDQILTDHKSAKDRRIQLFGS